LKDNPKKDVCSKGGIEVGNDVGAQSIVLSGSSIGDGCVVAGFPTKVVRYRFDEETIELLLNLKIVIDGICCFSLKCLSLRGSIKINHLL